MAHPEFTIMLARQRSGTNALRSVLDTHTDICCFDEVFKIEDRWSDDPMKRAYNYFTFLEQYCDGDVSKAFPDRHEMVFRDYCMYLRGLTAKKFLLIDVKYNSTHHLSGVWRGIADPTMFALLTANHVGVLHVTRRNLLRSLVSNMKAWDSKRYHVLDGLPPADVRVSLPAAWALSKMESWAAEDESVAGAFDGYPLYKRVDYTDLFPDSTDSIAAAALRDLAGWFGVPEAFTNRASFSKLSSLPLAETIENVDELRSAFQGTRFASFFDDEPSYR